MSVYTAWNVDVPVGYRRDFMFIPDRGEVYQPAVVIRRATREEYLSQFDDPTARLVLLDVWGFRYFYEVATD